VESLLDMLSILPLVRRSKNEFDLVNNGVSIYFRRKVDNAQYEVREKKSTEGVLSLGNIPDSFKDCPVKVPRAGN
jgi:hypothetical protein